VTRLHAVYDGCKSESIAPCRSGYEREGLGGGAGSQCNRYRRFVSPAFTLQTWQVENNSNDLIFSRARYQFNAHQLLTDLVHSGAATCIPPCFLPPSARLAVVVRVSQDNGVLLDTWERKSIQWFRSLIYRPLRRTLLSQAVANSTPLLTASFS